MSDVSVAASHRVPARELVTPEQLAACAIPSSGEVSRLIAHAWAVIFGAMAFVAVFPNPLAYVLAVMLIGSRQLGLAILMHEGAHRCFSRNEAATWPSANGCAPIRSLPTRKPIDAITFSIMLTPSRRMTPTSCCPRPSRSPRRAIAASFCATSPAALATSSESHSSSMRSAIRPGRLARRARYFREKLGNQVAVNALLWAGLALAGFWWAYPLLWLVPLLTWMMVITRIRNIAEHAVVPDSNDPLRNTRTTEASLLERIVHRALLRQLPPRASPAVLRALLQPAQAARILMQGPHAARMEVQRGYLSVLRLATAKPDAEDRPGEIVNNARRSSAATFEPRSGLGGFLSREPVLYFRFCSCPDVLADFPFLDLTKEELRRRRKARPLFDPVHQVELGAENQEKENDCAAKHG